MSTFDNISGHESSIFVTKPAEQFDCPLCLNVLNDPRQCINGHCFCFDCISAALAKCEACPMCKVDLNVASLSKSLMIGSLIDDLPAYCVCREEETTFYSEDTTGGLYCQWVSKFQDRQNQYTNRCEFFKIACSNNGCGLMIKRHQLTKHMESECLFRISACEYCHSEQFSMDELAIHHENCDFLPVQCIVNGCTETIVQSKLDYHMDNECLYSRAYCPLVASGICQTCTTPQPRGVLYEKHASNPHDTMKTYDMLSTRIEQLKKELYAAKAEKDKAIAEVNEKLETVVMAHDRLLRRLEMLEARDKAATTNSKDTTNNTTTNFTCSNSTCSNSTCPTRAVVIKATPEMTAVSTIATGHKFNKSQKKKMMWFNEILDMLDKRSTTTSEAKFMYEGVTFDFRRCSSVMRLELVKAFTVRFFTVDLADLHKIHAYTELFRESFIGAPELFTVLSEIPKSAHMSILTQIGQNRIDHRKAFWKSACLMVSGAANRAVNGVYRYSECDGDYFVHYMREDGTKLSGVDGNTSIIIKRMKSEWNLVEVHSNNNVSVFCRTKANFWETFPPEDAKWRSVNLVTRKETCDASLAVVMVDKYSF